MALKEQKERWARLYVDKSKESPIAVNLLRNSGYIVVTIPVEGRMGPELKFGGKRYRTLEEIKELVNSSR